MRYYLSHAIRGKEGTKASHDTQAQNGKEAIRVADTLRKLFPKLELYVPAEHEAFVQIAYDAGYLAIREILTIDCMIINNMDGVIVYVPTGKIQGGRKVEYDHAVKTNKPVIIFQKTSEAAGWLNAKYRGALI